MNILVLCKKAPYPCTDGESIVIMSDINRLKSIGHSVFLFCINTKKHFIDTSEYKKNELWTDFEDVHMDTNGISTLLKAVFSPTPLQLSRFYKDEIEIKLEEYLVKNKIDMVLYQGLAMTLYLQNQSNIKKYYRIHNLEHTIWSRMSVNSKNLVKKYFYRLLASSLARYEENCLHAIDHFIGLNPSEAEYFSKIYPKPSSTIPISIDNQDSESYSVDNEGLLFIGSLDWQPNRQGLNWFLETIYPKISHIPLTIAGKGKFDSTQYPNLSVISNFEKIEDLFSSHRLMIVPLLAGGGIRIKILEAMQAGMPTISTEIGAEGILHQDSVLIRNSSEEWIETIMSYYNEKMKLQTLSENLKTTYQNNYSSHKIEELWKLVLEKLN